MPRELPLVFRRVVTVAALLLVVLASAGCGAARSASRADSFRYWLRFYEARMGLPPTEVRIGPTPLESCGWVGFAQALEGDDLEALAATLRPGRPVVVYDPELEGCRTPADVALREACHIRYAHPWLDLEAVAAEAEVDACATAYLRRTREARSQ